MKAVILGTLRGTTKNGKNFMNIFATKNFSDYEMQNNTVEGVPCFTEFTYNDFNLKPGDEVEFVYEPGFQGRASLVDVIPLKLAEQAAKPAPVKPDEQAAKPVKQ